jgi:hypothetical protein
MSNQATMLQFDWKEVDGVIISAVLATGSRRMNDGSLVCDQIALMLGTKAVVIRVSDDTDEVTVSLEDAATNNDAKWQTLDQLSGMVSRRIGWCWVGRNYRGYLDTFTIALEGIDAAYSFTGGASRLQCSRVTPIAA